MLEDRMPPTPSRYESFFLHALKGLALPKKIGGST